MMGSIVLVVSHVVRFRTHAHLAGDAAWPKLTVCLFGYALVMVIVTYAAILVYYISGGVLDLMEVRYSLSFIYFVWMMLQLWSLSAWLGTAILIFRRMFRQWL